MTEDIQVLDLHFPPISDAELDACVASLQEPSAASQANYQRMLDFMLQINADAGVFQNVEAECAPEEAKVANSGKYMDTNYTWRYGRDAA
jgi:hypothetical protein